MWNIYIVNFQAKSTKNYNPSYTKKSVQNGLKYGWNLTPLPLGVPSKLKLHKECNFCWLFLGEEQEASALLSKKGERGVYRESAKFDFFSYDDTPYWCLV